MINDIEQQLLAGVQGGEGWSLVEAFAATRRELPEEFEAGAADLVARLHRLDLPAQLHKPSIYLGIPRQATIVCEGRSFRSKATALSPSTPRFTAPLVHMPGRNGASRVHTDDPALLFGADVTHDVLRQRIAGKVVITEGLSNPGRSELFQSLGALASITINPGEAVHWGASSTIWGSPGLGDMDRLPRMPSLAVNTSDGALLVAAAGRGATVEVGTDVLHGWFEQTLPVVDIQADGPDAHEFVLIHGHLDSWDLGVGDNATGNAVLLEVARALHAGRRHLRRSVRIAWWPGHSAGRYAGSTWFADRFAHELRAGCVAHLNCDSPGCRDATDYGSIRGMAEAQPLVAGAVADLFGQTTTLERPGRAGDYSFNNLGLTGAMLTSSMVPPEERQRRGWYAVGGNGGSPTWHTEDDVLEVADRGVLENDVRLYTLIAARLACAPVPQLDYRRPLAAVGERLAQAATLTRTQVDLTAHLRLHAQLTGRVDEHYDAAAAQPASGVAWQRLLPASRAIVRSGFAEGDAFDQDPAYAQPEVPMLGATAELGADPAAQVTLQRGANRLRAELEAALDAFDR